MNHWSLPRLLGVSRRPSAATPLLVPPDPCSPGPSGEARCGGLSGQGPRGEGLVSTGHTARGQCPAHTLPQCRAFLPLPTSYFQALLSEKLPEIGHSAHPGGTVGPHFCTGGVCVGGILRKRCVFVYLGLRVPRPPRGHLSVCTCPPFGGATPTPVPSFALPIPHCSFCGPGHVHGLPPAVSPCPHTPAILFVGHPSAGRRLGGCQERLSRPCHLPWAGVGRVCKAARSWGRCLEGRPMLPSRPAPTEKAEAQRWGSDLPTSHSGKETEPGLELDPALSFPVELSAAQGKWFL